jgi:hypothetical protein
MSEIRDNTKKILPPTKALITFEYIICLGSDNLRHDWRQFQDQFQLLTSVETTDVGEIAASEAVARKKAADVVTLLHDSDAYQMERDPAKKVWRNIRTYGRDEWGGVDVRSRRD